MKTSNRKISKKEILGVLLFYFLFVIMSALALAGLNVGCNYVFDDHDLITNNTIYRVIMLFGSIVPIAVLNSLIMIFQFRNVHERDRFLENEKDTFIPKKAAGSIIKSRKFLIEFAVICGMILLSPFGIGLECISGLIIGRLVVPQILQRLISFAVMVPIVFGCLLLGKINSRKDWLRRGYDPEKMFKVKKFVSQIIVTTVAYWLGFMAFPMVFAGIFSVFSIIFAFIKWQGSIIVVALIVLLIFMKQIIALNRRRVFFKKLRKLCKKQHFELGKIKHAYLSAFFDSDEPNFCVTANGKTYECKCISSVVRGNPVIFKPNGVYSHDFVAKFAKTELLRYEQISHYGFESKHQKIIIMVPTAKSVYIEEGSRRKIVDNGDKLFEYKIFTGGAFVRALERDAIK